MSTFQILLFYFTMFVLLFVIDFIYTSVLHLGIFTNFNLETLIN